MAGSLPTVRELCVYRYLMSVMAILLLAVLSSKGASQEDCSLDISNPIIQNRSDCGVGNWGGFLPESCCYNRFDEFLDMLGRRANRTGRVFLNVTEQKNCLPLMESTFGGISGCGIDRLTADGDKGGCSEFSVGDVLNKLGDDMRALGNDCKLSDNGVGTGIECDLCLRRWDAIGGSYSEDQSSLNISSDVCKFAVLVTLTSTNIMDEKWVRLIYECFREHLGDSRAGQKRGRKSIFMRTGIWVLIGAFIGLVVVMVLALWYLSKKRLKSDKPDLLNIRAKSDKSDMSKERPKSDMSYDLHLPQEKDASKESLHEEPGCQKIPVKEIYAATNDLSALNFIGQGIAGKVYKGTLSNGCDVAVKHIVKDGYVETFLREITSLSHVRHPNLVTLIGYCDEEDEYFLVYELCVNGNLSEWLFEKNKKLSWIQRLEIAVGSARGLWFLHTYEECCIVHRDIKPTNILLGSDFGAKLSDFGLSKVMDTGVSYVSSEVRGTFGYVDPEYRQNHRVNAAGDVYSFGIVLLQILSGRRAVTLDVKPPLSLNKMAKHLMRGGNISEFADPKLNGDYSAEAFVLTLQVALSCTGEKRGRPSMGQVVTRLEDALDMSTGGCVVRHQSPPFTVLKLRSQVEPNLHMRS